MNSTEGMDLAKMAVTVLLVVLVIGAVVALVYAGYSWFNSGADKLGDQVNSIDASSYAQYDDVQVSGTDVLTALKTYRDSDIAIVISNSKNQNGTYDPAATSVTAYCYCGMLYVNADGNGTPPATKPDASATITITRADSSSPWSGVAIAWDSATGLAYRNTNFSPTTSKSSQSTYVKQGAQFYANLIYDTTTDEVCGILFRQMN